MWRKHHVHRWWERTFAATMENGMGIFQKKRKIELLYEPTISLLGTYPKKTKTLI